MNEKCRCKHCLKEELEELISEACGDKDRINNHLAVMNCLARGQFVDDGYRWREINTIKSVEDLKNTSLETISKFKGMGKKHLAIVERAKNIIEERGL